MRARGFTLVEVLVALVIVAAGASAVLSSLNSAAISTVYLRERTLAHWIADNRIAETRLATTPPQNGTSGGEIDYAGGRWQWRQQVAAGDIPGLRRIDVSVRPAGQGGPVAGDAATGGDWMLTVSGVLGSDLAPPGAALDWEPPPNSPDPGNRTPGPNGNGNGETRGTGAPPPGGAGGGAAPARIGDGISEGPPT